MYQYKTRLFCKDYEASHRRMSIAVSTAGHAAFDYLEECVGFRDHELPDILQRLTNGDDALMGAMVKRASKMVAHLYVWESHESGHMARMTYAEFKRVKEKLYENARVVGLEWEMLQYKLRVEPWFFGQHNWTLHAGEDKECYGSSLVSLRYNCISTLYEEQCDKLAPVMEED